MKKVEEAEQTKREQAEAAAAAASEALINESGKAEDGAEAAPATAEAVSPAPTALSGVPKSNTIVGASSVKGGDEPGVEEEEVDEEGKNYLHLILCHDHLSKLLVMYGQLKASRYQLRPAIP